MQPKDCDLSEEQKDLLRSIATGLANGSISTSWNYGTFSVFGKGLQIGQISAIPDTIWEQYWAGVVEEEDFHAFVECGFFRWVGVKKLTLNKKKILAAIENNFREKNDKSKELKSTVADLNKRVFISYRRSISKHLARSIFLELRSVGYDAFLDVNSIDNGTFDTVILNQIAARPHFILILAEGSLDRIINEDDWLKKEIETAIDLDRNIIPILDEGFSFEPIKHLLTGKLKELGRYNGIRLFHDYFEDAISKLLDRYLKQIPDKITIKQLTPQEESEAQSRIQGVFEENMHTNNEQEKMPSLDIEMVKVIVNESFQIMSEELFNKLTAYKSTIALSSKHNYFGSPIQIETDIFMLMPFLEYLNPVYTNHIKPIAESLGFSIKRGDEFFSAHNIIEETWSLINNSRLVIADCTGKNANVFYEMGLAHAIDKPVIIISQNEEDIPFDIRQRRYIKYEFTPRGMKQFEDELKKAIRIILQT